MSREELRDGYTKLMTSVYAPEAYFGRLDSLFLSPWVPTGDERIAYWRHHPLRRLGANAMLLCQALALYMKLMHGVSEAALRREYRSRVWRLLRIRREPFVLFSYLIRCTMHYHFHTLARTLSTTQRLVPNTI